MNEGRIRTEHFITNGRILGQSVGSKRSKDGLIHGERLKADYVLQYRNRNIGIIEAKADTQDFTEGVGQAKEYATRLQVRFAFSTNGKRIYCIDMQEGTESEVREYPTPDELWAMTFDADSECHTKRSRSANEESGASNGLHPESSGLRMTPPDHGINWMERFSAVPFEDRGGTWQPRYYQENAITNALDAMAEGRDRILLTLATGTGKTAIAFQICWKLYQSRWNLRRDGSGLPRILFLADRNVLADQAFNAFNLSFEENALVRITPEEIRKAGKVPTSGSLFFTIFQTFMTGGNTDAGETEDMEAGKAHFWGYPKDFFDLIIIDECHRAGAKDNSSWRAIMEYFKPAVQIGLTATPKRDVNGDTYRYFGDPVYVYSLKEGINDGFLTPFRYKEMSTTGDEYTYTEGDIVMEGEVEYGRTYTQEEQNRVIILEDVERFRVQKLLESIDQRHKTIVFCNDQLHALAVRNLINQLSTSRNPHYCHRVTADDGKQGEQYLKHFQDNQSSIPTILTTSQKLSTGVDAPEVRNIVLMRVVRSMVEFKQIIGRGTRLHDGKSYFTVYDFYWRLHTHFEDPEWDGPPEEPEPPVERPLTDPCLNCGQRRCICNQPPPELCELCAKHPCECEGEPRPKKIRIKMADGSVRDLQGMTRTRYYGKNGQLVTGDAFIQELFGDLPSFFSDEEKLREIWSTPDTRRKLLEEMKEKGYSEEQLKELQELVHGRDSDLYDVLSYVAYHRDLVPRSDRADRAKVHFATYDPKQQEFLNFVLEQYVRSGVHELDDQKLPQLLDLKYKSVADAKAQLGSPNTIRDTFIGFQKWLYGEVG